MERAMRLRGMSTSVLGSGLAFTHTLRPLPTFLLVQNGSRFSAGSCGDDSAKQRWMPDDDRRA
jgi:hypothetical protein